MPESSVSSHNPDIVTVIPVGPNCRVEFVVDTLESLDHYLRTSNVTVLVDDTGSATCSEIAKQFDDVDVLRQQETRGLKAGLYLTLSKAFSYVLHMYRPRIVLRLDTDAILIGPGPDIDAIRQFETFPEQGMIGSYRVDCNGRVRNFNPPARLLEKDLKITRLLRRPLTRGPGWVLLQRMLWAASRNGYEPGEHVLGGACFYSLECLERLSDADLLGREELRWSKMQEDHIFSMLTRAVGMKLGDFSTGDHPMAIKWRGLPDHPEALLERGMKVAHSTNYYENLDERRIREIFREARESSGG